MNNRNSSTQTSVPGRTLLDREAWTAFALSVLAEDGLDGLRVEVLARRLKVTKGSFYWHFKDRQALLNAVATYWRDLRIQELEAQASIPAEQAREHIHAIIDQYATQPNHIRLQLELAIRDWARRDPLVAAAVEAVDQARLRNATRLFELAGFDQEEAQTRALLMFTHVFGLSMMMFEESILTSVATRHSAIARLITLETP